MIELINVTKIYNEGKKNECVALREVSFVIEDNEFVAIMGKSGAGKSTLLYLLGLIDTMTSGDIIINYRNTNNLNDSQKANIRNKELGIIMQDFALINNFSMLDNILLPISLDKGDKKDKIARAKALIDKLDLSDVPLNKPVKNLSGGQKQRVAIARALINEPNIILADEPTGSVDENAAWEVMEIFKSMHSEGKTIIIVTHDRDIANQCDRLIEIKKGEIVQDTKSKEIITRDYKKNIYEESRKH